jgi:hypothetical protein
MSRGRTGTFLAAAYRILKDAGHPMHCREIVALVKDEGLAVTNAVDPVDSWTGTLYSETSRGPNPRGFVLLGNGVFGLREWGDSGQEAEPSLRPPSHAPQQTHRIPDHVEQPAPIVARRVAAAPQTSHAALDGQVQGIRAFLAGRAQRPSDERLCDWIHLCYEFELYHEGRDLFPLVDPSQVNPWYYERARRLAKVCAMKAAGQA